MNTIALEIKKLRNYKGYTQEDMAEKLSLSAKAYQKIENGVTKLDIERLNKIAEILEVTVTDLVNAQDSIYVHQAYNQIGVSNKEVVINNNLSETERQLFEKIIEDKDKEIAFLRDLLKKHEGNSGKS